MRTFLPVLLAVAAAAFAADPQEARILQLMDKVMDQRAGELALEVKESGPGFVVYFAKRTGPDGKKLDFQAFVYQPGRQRVIVGDYFNLSRYKDIPFDAEFYSEFLSNTLGSTMRVTVGETKPDGTRLTVLQETGYGKVVVPAHLFGRFHFIMGKSYDLGDDPAAKRAGAIRWDLGGTVGPADAPNTLAVFIDMECPHCARIEKELLAILKDRKDIRAGFFQFPLTVGHPLSFKAAAAAHCFLDRGSDLYFQFLEYFYPLRKDVEFETVDLTNYGFAEMKDLEEPFLACYMKEANIASVLAAMQMAVDLGVAHTPMIYYNGLSYYPSDIVPLLKPAEGVSEPPPVVPSEAEGPKDAGSGATPEGS